MRSYAMLFMLSIATQASAQSAEDTFLYLTNGVESGTPKVVTQRGTTLTMTPLGGNELGVTLDVSTEGQKSTVGKFVYKKVDDCNYEAIISLNEKKGVVSSPLKETVKLRMDYSHVAGLSVKSRRGMLVTKLSGLKMECEQLRDVPCDKVVGGGENIPFMNFGEEARVLKAFDFFRTTYCKGSAF